MVRKHSPTTAAPSSLSTSGPSSDIATENSVAQQRLSSDLAALGPMDAGLPPMLASAAGAMQWTPAPSLQAVRGGELLRRGHRGDSVSTVQGLLGVSSDGDSGAQTESAVGAFQDGAKLRPPNGMRGMVGATTLKHLERQGSGSGSTGDGQVGPYAAWTTGSGGSSLLDASGKWDTSDFREHHSDRTNSAAADRVRAGRNIPHGSVEAYDFTFERLDGRGRAVEGTAHGLPMMTPVRSKVLDIQSTFEGSGGYGKFILLEYNEGDLAGERVEIHHLDSVGEFSVGQILPGGVVFGAQGGSGNGRHSYATHIDIVGTARSVALFVRANQSGRFQTTTKPEQPEPGGDQTPGTTTPPDPQAKPGQYTAAPSLSEVRSGRGVLREWHRGEAVTHVQKQLGVTADGDFGPATKQAVANFQRTSKLTPPSGMEGVVGATTLQHLDRSGAVSIGAPGAFGIAPLAVSGTDRVGDYPAPLRAFLRAITYAEGTPDAGGYTREVGGKQYASSQRVHPGAANVRRYQQTGFNSDAYGRYQFLSDTWAEWASAAKIPVAQPGTNSYGESYHDISPQHQDMAALAFLLRRGVLEELQSGRVSSAVSLVSSTWASLPGGPKPNDRTRSFYTVYDRMLAEEQAADARR